MILDDYNTWLYSQAILDRNDRINYSKLLSKLNNIPFGYMHPMDVNRYDDGIQLRYRFGAEEGYDDIVICNEVDVRLCSVLEMMVALALHMEENIMIDTNYGPRPDRWFMEMLDSLQLIHMTNQNYNSTYVDDRINKLITRNYSLDGSGGLFKLKNPRIDMREIEIWQQAMLYLTENFSER
jgi:hypothetical protein